MAGRILVTQALDERELLAKKIRNKIQKASFVDCMRPNEVRVYKRFQEEDDYIKEAEETYQQINDLITRYDKLTVAIGHSNASNFIETSYGTYTVADAIALRSRLKESGNSRDLDFETLLYNKLGEDYKDAVVTADEKNQQLKKTAEEMRLSILGRDNSRKEEKPLAVVEAYVKDNTMVPVDPLNSLTKMMALREKHDTLLKELEVGIKVANATNFIEI